MILPKMEIVQDKNTRNKCRVEKIVRKSKGQQICKLSYEINKIKAAKNALKYRL